MCSRKIKEEIKEAKKKDDDHDEKILEKYVKLFQHKIRPRTSRVVPFERPSIRSFDSVFL